MTDQTTQLEPPMWTAIDPPPDRPSTAAPRGQSCRLELGLGGLRDLDAFSPAAFVGDAVRARTAQVRPPSADVPLPDVGALDALAGTLSRWRVAALPIFVADLIALGVTCAVAYVVCARVAELPTADLARIVVALALPILGGNLLLGLYPGTCSNPVVEFRQLSRVAAIAFLGLAALACLGGRSGAGAYVLFFAIAGPVQFVGAPIARVAVRHLCCRRSWWGYPVIVFGSGPAAANVIGKLLANPEFGLRPIAALAPNARPGLDVGGVPVIGTPRLAATIAKRLRVGHAIVVRPDLTRSASTRVLKRYAKGIRHVMMTSAIDSTEPGLAMLWRDTRDLAGVAGTEVRNRLLVPTPRLIKRTMDVTLTVVGGLCLLPLVAVLAACVKWSSPGPVFYGQPRAGLRGRRFKALKFRTMIVNGDDVFRDHLAANPGAREEWERDQKLKDDPRVTRIGALLRRCSLDELPQLWNVLRGEMSLVGPRPIPLGEIEKYGASYHVYKSVRPGITGLWQVSGRNDTAYDDRLRYVEYYVRNWSPWFDMHLLARTVTTLLFSKGAY